MERPKAKVDDPVLNDIVEHIVQNGLGNIVIFESAPTNAQMKANTLGYYNGELYVKLANGVAGKIPITII